MKRDMTPWVLWGLGALLSILSAVAGAWWSLSLKVERIQTQLQGFTEVRQESTDLSIAALEGRIREAEMQIAALRSSRRR